MSSNQNDEVILKTVAKLSSVPFHIRDVLLILNCRDHVGDIKVGSLFVGEVPELSSSEKMILVAQIMKTLRVTPADYMTFLGENP